MNAYTPEYNSQVNQFREGVRLIRRRHGHFFDNAVSGHSIYDLKDINCYFEIGISMGQTVLQFRKNSGLPESIRDEITTLFHSVWPAAAETNNS